MPNVVGVQVMNESAKPLRPHGSEAIEDKKNSSPDTAYVTIAELAEEFDVSLRTLRFYESKGLLSPKRQGLNRLYSNNDKNRLAAILKGKKLGFTLGEISAMLKDERRGAKPAQLKMSAEKVADQIRYLEAQKAEVEQALAKLLAYREEVT